MNRTCCSFTTGGSRRILKGQVKRIAEFIGVDPRPLKMATILEHCSFEYMRGRADQLAPFGGKHMTESKAFFHKGPRRDYRVELMPEQIARFDRLAIESLGSECARWLETGSTSGEYASSAAVPSAAHA